MRSENSPFALDYGLKEIWLVRFRDDNCSRDWISFFTLDENILPNRIIKEHHDHDNFDMHIVKIIASSLEKNSKDNK